MAKFSYSGSSDSSLNDFPKWSSNIFITLRNLLNANAKGTKEFKYLDPRPFFNKWGIGYDEPDGQKIPEQDSEVQKPNNYTYARTDALDVGIDNLDYTAGKRGASDSIKIPNNEDNGNPEWNNIINLLMPQYARRVEVEDLDKNFWVIGVTLDCIVNALWGRNNSVIETILGIIDELIDIRNMIGDNTVIDIGLRIGNSDIKNFYKQIELNDMHFQLKTDTSTREIDIPIETYYPTGENGDKIEDASQGITNWSEVCNYYNSKIMNNEEVTIRDSDLFFTSKNIGTDYTFNFDFSPYFYDPEGILAENDGVITYTDNTFMSSCSFGTYGNINLENNSANSITIDDTLSKQCDFKNKIKNIRITYYSIKSFENDSEKASYNILKANIHNYYKTMNIDTILGEEDSEKYLDLGFNCFLYVPEKYWYIKYFSHPELEATVDTRPNNRDYVVRRIDSGKYKIITDYQLFNHNDFKKDYANIIKESIILTDFNDEKLNSLYCKILKYDNVNKQYNCIVDLHSEHSILVFEYLESNYEEGLTYSDWKKLDPEALKPATVGELGGIYSNDLTKGYDFADDFIRRKVNVDNVKARCVISRSDVELATMKNIIEGKTTSSIKIIPSSYNRSYWAYNNWEMVLNNSLRTRYNMCFAIISEQTTDNTEAKCVTIFNNRLQAPGVAYSEDYFITNGKESQQWSLVTPQDGHEAKVTSYIYTQKVLKYVNNSYVKVDLSVNEKATTIAQAYDYSDSSPTYANVGYLNLYTVSGETNPLPKTSDVVLRHDMYSEPMKLLNNRYDTFTGLNNIFETLTDVNDTTNEIALMLSSKNYENTSNYATIGDNYILSNYYTYDISDVDEIKFRRSFEITAPLFNFGQPNANYADNTHYSLFNKYDGKYLTNQNTDSSKCVQIINNYIDGHSNELNTQYWKSRIPYKYIPNYALTIFYGTRNYNNGNILTQRLYQIRQAWKNKESVNSVDGLYQLTIGDDFRLPETAHIVMYGTDEEESYDLTSNESSYTLTRKENLDRNITSVQYTFPQETLFLRSKDLYHYEMISFSIGTDKTYIPLYKLKTKGNSNYDFTTQQLATMKNSNTMLSLQNNFGVSGYKGNLNTYNETAHILFNKTNEDKKKQAIPLTYYIPELRNYKNKINTEKYYVPNVFVNTFYKDDYTYNAKSLQYVNYFNDVLYNTDSEISSIPTLIKNEISISSEVGECDNFAGGGYMRNNECIHSFSNLFYNSNTTVISNDNSERITADLQISNLNPMTFYLDGTLFTEAGADLLEDFMNNFGTSSYQGEGITQTLNNLITNYNTLVNKINTTNDNFEIVGRNTANMLENLMASITYYYKNIICFGFYRSVPQRFSKPINLTEMYLSGTSGGNAYRNPTNYMILGISRADMNDYENRKNILTSKTIQNLYPRNLELLKVGETGIHCDITSSISPTNSVRLDINNFSHDNTQNLIMHEQNIGYYQKYVGYIILLWSQKDSYDEEGHIISSAGNSLCQVRNLRLYGETAPGYIIF